MTNWYKNSITCLAVWSSPSCCTGTEIRSYVSPSISTHWWTPITCWSHSCWCLGCCWRVCSYAISPICSQLKPTTIRTSACPAVRFGTQQAKVTATTIVICTWIEGYAWIIHIWLHIMHTDDMYTCTDNMYTCTDNMYTCTSDHLLSIYSTTVIILNLNIKFKGFIMNLILCKPRSYLFMCSFYKSFNRYMLGTA